MAASHPRQPHHSWSDARRAEGLSDGVFAIVITLLVLDLHVREVEAGRLLTALRHQWPNYLAYLMSFLYVAVIWLNHKRAFDHIRHLNRPLHWANLSILLTTSLIPFPTAVVSLVLDRGNTFDSRVAVSLYALFGILICLSWFIFFAYLARHRELIHPDHQWSLDREMLRATVGLVLYAGAGIAAWFTTPVTALIVFLLLPLFYGITSYGFASEPPPDRPR